MGSLGYDSLAKSLASSRTEIAWRPITEAEDFPNFPRAWQACIDDSKGQVWMTSRRAAKTGTAIRRTVKRSSERAGWRTLYIHRTRALAKSQFFETGDTAGVNPNLGVREVLRKHGIPEMKKDLTELWLRLPNGSLIQAVGCDDIRDVDKKLGFQWDDLLLDECQDFDDDVLERLVKKTILPTLIDRRGGLTMLGTPAEVEFGFWFEMYTNGPLTKHNWTLLDNPFIDRDAIVETMAKAGYVIDFVKSRNNDPLIQREIFGLHAIDKNALLYAFDESRNLWLGGVRPDLTKGDWCFALGLDIGGANEGNDRDACNVLGWRMDDPAHQLIEVESWEERLLDSEEFAARVDATYSKWIPVAACGDTGGAGANKAMKTVSKRVGGINWTPKPTSVDLSMRLLNDEFRSGRFKAAPNGLIARDCKLCTKKGKYHSDVMAAVRYAHHCASHFLGQGPPPPETDEERRIRQWLERKAAAEDPYGPYGGNHDVYS